MKKKLLVLITIFALLMCTACGAQKTGTETEESSQANTDVDKKTDTEAKESSTSPYPMTIIDQAGREVVLEHKPVRLVSSYYITTTVLLALDLKDKIKGIESNPEKRNIYSLCAPELFEVTQVGSPKEFDLEACASVQPDLVILPLRAKDMVEPLEKLGITVMVVNPESQEDIYEMIQLIGTATERYNRANELVGYIQEQISYIEKQMTGVDTPNVYFGGNSSLLSTAPKDMYQNDLISIAGGKNVAGEIDDTYWVEVSYEQVLDWNPEYIILASDGGYSLDEVQNDSNLAYCQAVVDHNVYRIPSDIESWDSPVPSSFLGVAYICSVLHPDVIDSKQYENMVEEYYEKFYGFSYSK